MNQKERKILNFLRENPDREHSVGRIANKCNIDPSDMTYILAELELKRFVSCRRRMSNKIADAKITELGLGQYEAAVLGIDSTSIGIELERLKQAVEELQELFKDIQNKTPNQKEALSKRLNTYADLFTKAPQIYELIKNLLS